MPSEFARQAAENLRDGSLFNWIVVPTLVLVIYIYSVEVENQLAFHPEVIECAIIAKPCEVLGERVRAIVVPRGEGTEALADEIRAFAAQRLSEYKVPEEVIFRADPLPRNPNGKVIKNKLRDEYAGL